MTAIKKNNSKLKNESVEVPSAAIQTEIKTKMKRIVLVILVSLMSHVTVGQSLTEGNLTKFQWTTDSTINGLNLGNFKEIGLTKLRISADSLKKDCSIWTFTENKIIIQKYSVKNGLESDSISCSYEYKNGELLIYHFSQDSTFWKYHVGIVSTENYILLRRKKK